MKKAFEILDKVCRADSGLTLSDLSRGLGISKSTVLGIAEALEERGALVRDPLTKRYTPGLALYRLGRAVRSRPGIEEIARPILEDLRTRTEESVFMGAAGGDHVYVLGTAESTREMKITSPVGTRIPLLAGATGKVFMASLDEGQAAGAVRTRGLQRYTPKTVTDVDRYLADVREVRERGWASDEEEYLMGVWAVAAPVRVSPVHALWVVGLAASLVPGRMAEVASLVVSAADGIARIAEEGDGCRASA